jgi:hypothetical protein
VVVVVGLTVLFHTPFPVPVTVPPPLFNIKVHAPLAVMVPLMLVLPPLHMLVLLLVIAATGLAFTVTISDPVRSAGMEVHCASLREAMA